MLWKRISAAFSQQKNRSATQNSHGENPENIPHQLIALAVKEIEQAIAKNKKTLQQVRQNKQNLEAKVDFYLKDSVRLHQLAIEAVRRKREDEADEYLMRKAATEKQVQQYRVLLNNLNATVRDLEQQIDLLNLKLEETRTKETMLSAKFESFKTQRELNQYLDELDHSENISLYEDEVTRAQVELELTQDIMRLDSEVAELERKFSIHDIEAEIAAKDEADKQKRQEQAIKKAQLYFSQHAEAEKKALEAKKSQVAAQKEQLMRDFMTARPMQDPQQQDMVQAFFSAAPLPAQQLQSDKAALMQAFFAQEAAQNQSAIRPDKQKLLSDFFGDSQDQG